MSERTLAIVKPDAVKKNAIGDIINRYEKAGLRPVAMRLMHMSKATAQGFYAVHKARPFFDSLCTFMSSGPCVVLVLQGDNAIKKNRELMGATDPAKAEQGTIRAAHGANIEFNAVHGSDAPETAKFEIGYFFAEMALVGSAHVERSQVLCDPCSTVLAGPSSWLATSFSHPAHGFRGWLCRFAAGFDPCCRAADGNPGSRGGDQPLVPSLHRVLRWTVFRRHSSLRTISHELSEIPSRAGGPLGSGAGV